jgi:hypothetical protein
MEFFNPIRNPVHYTRLAQHFGCELIECYRNIATGERPGLEQTITETWNAASHNFTKEVFSPMKLGAFAKHFRCFVLLRATADSLPPKRLRVWSFYEHAWHALREAGIPLRETTLEARARAAHEWLSEELAADARRLAVPVIHYRELFAADDRVRETVARAIGECAPALLAAVVASRTLAARW